MDEQTKRDRRVELIHITVLILGMFIILETMIKPDQPIIIPLSVALIWTILYWMFVKIIPRKYSGQV